MAGYRELKIWQIGVQIALDVYRLTDDFPKSEIYGLTSQMRRAAVSIASNIAEGHARKSHRDFQRFIGIAKGSLAELKTQLIIAKELGFVENEQAAKLPQLANEESRMLSGLQRSLNGSSS